MLILERNSWRVITESMVTKKLFSRIVAVINVSLMNWVSWQTMFWCQRERKRVSDTCLLHYIVSHRNYQLLAHLTPLEIASVRFSKKYTRRHSISYSFITIILSNFFFLSINPYLNSLLFIPLFLFVLCFSKSFNLHLFSLFYCFYECVMLWLWVSGESYCVALKGMRFHN